jgi:peptidyl-prolyl cis-trans isomerase SurA
MKDSMLVGRIFFLFLASSVHSVGFGQTLFTLGSEAVSKAEFLRAYNKNIVTGKPTEKSYRDYLQLYIRYKLKVKAAYDLRLDTLAAQVTELQNFRRQIVESYLSDQVSISKLVAEAFVRSQKDIHLAEIFISAPQNISSSDSLKALDKTKQVLSALQKGMDFQEAALKFSDDPNIKLNRGDLGFITVFSLPYDLETIAYQTKPGAFSRLLRLPEGYLIIKNLGERKALGRVKIAQILLVYPYNANEAAKAEVQHRADSICEVLNKGGDFAELARKFSGDNLSYQIGGDIPEFGVGRYDQAFENAAFGLTRVGQISLPVATTFGYHIIKLENRSPVSDQKDKKTMALLSSAVSGDPRIEVARKSMLQKIILLTGFKQMPVNKKDLWILTDSALLSKPLPPLQGLGPASVLFLVGNKSTTVKDWLDYRRSVRNVPVSRGAAAKSDEELFEKFREITATEYYRDHLELYNSEFAYQLKEFKDGNLLFEIMQRKIWDKASADSVGLQAYYFAHKNKYMWQPSADAIVFTFANAKTAQEVTGQIELDFNHWKKILDSSTAQAQADSGRFELTQLPPAEMGGWRRAHFTSMITNLADNTVTTAYVVNLYLDSQARSFKEARGMVVNDFQSNLEENWMETLKLKYPVKIDEVVFRSLPK